MNQRTSLSISIKLDVLKGSVNNMLIPMRGLTSQGKKRLIYGSNYRAAKAKVKKYLEENYKELEGIWANHPEFYYLEIHYIVYDNWLTKSSKYRKLRKKDVANYQKNTEDVLCSFLGVDDSFIRISGIEKGLIEPPVSAAQLSVSISLHDMDINAFKKMEA